MSVPRHYSGRGLGLPLPLPVSPGRAVPSYALAISASVGIALAVGQPCRIARRRYFLDGRIVVCPNSALPPVRFVLPPRSYATLPHGIERTPPPPPGGELPALPSVDRSPAHLLRGRRGRTEPLPVDPDPSVRFENRLVRRLSVDPPKRRRPAYGARQIERRPGLSTPEFVHSALPNMPDHPTRGSSFSQRTVAEH